MRSSEGGLLTVSTKVEFKSSAKQQGEQTYRETEHGHRTDTDVEDLKK